MRVILSVVFVIFGFIVFGQPEQLLRLTTNPDLLNRTEHQSFLAKATGSTFDSTFVYLPDTLQLPLFDDFTTNKFQNYLGSFVNPSITEYRLLDLGGIPLSNEILYTQQQTFRRTFDIGNGEYTDDNFPSTDIQIGDQTNYPTVYTTTSVYPPFYIYDTLDFPNDPDTIWISDAEIFQDSATIFFVTLNNLEAYWLDSEAFHNFTFAQDPWTLGVATFDGLDENGYPYSIGSTSENYADHLTSKPIDMSGNNPSDSIYLSFLYQAEGLGDVPETGDSLFLEFYDANLGIWNQVWSSGGETSQDFKIGHIRITNASYYTNAFQFRFKNWGALYGNLDHFHLDYVRLRTLSGYQDTTFEDLAFVYPVPSLIETYSSVPWDHYKNSVDVNSINRMNSETRMVLRSGFVNAQNNNQGATCNVYYGGSLEGSFFMPGLNLTPPDINYLSAVTYYSYHDFSGGYEFTTSHPGPIEEFEVVSIVEENLAGDLTHLNDTTRTKQVFANYYSYDDGSAERVYGTTESQSRIALRYEPYEADSLIGVMIHFVPHIEDMSNQLFLVSVWSDNNGEPDTVIYEDNPFFPRTPVYKNDRNKFATYYFQDTMKVPVNGAFHIGFRQLGDGVYGVGFDANTANDGNLYYYSPSFADWFPSSFDGTLMIRPIFSTSYDPYLGIENKGEIELVEFNVFPNPTGNILNIDYKGQLDIVEIYDFTGKKLMSGDRNSIDVSNLSQGVYLVRVNNSSKAVKFIKE